LNALKIRDLFLFFLFYFNDLFFLRSKDIRLICKKLHPDEWQIVEDKKQTVCSVLFKFFKMHFF
uniref:hypothetical protein n=1 Tax=Acinetobacter venetianus TaxID=52133 RepID=UPI003A93CD13